MRSQKFVKRFFWLSLLGTACVVHAMDGTCGKALFAHQGSDVWAYDESGSQRISAAINTLQLASLRLRGTVFQGASELLKQSRFDRRDRDIKTFSVNIVDTLRLFAQTMAPDLESDVTMWRLSSIESDFRRPEIIEVDSFRTGHWQLGPTGAKLIFGKFTHHDRTPDTFGLFLILQATTDEMIVMDTMSKNHTLGRLKLTEPMPWRGMKLTTFAYTLDEFPSLAQFTPYTVTALDLHSPTTIHDQWNSQRSTRITLENLEIDFGEGRNQTKIWTTSRGQYQIRIGNEAIAPARLLVAGDDGNLLRLVFNVPLREVVLAEPSKFPKRAGLEHHFVEHYTVTLLKQNLSIGSVRRFYVDPMTKEEYAWPGASSYNRILYSVTRSSFSRYDK